MPAGLATAGQRGKAVAFASAAEMREVLTELLSGIEQESELGLRMRTAQVAYRYLFPDLGLSLNITSSDDPERCIRWTFSEKAEWEPGLTLEMSSEVANRYLQGRENLAIALTRGRIRCSGAARVALSLLPITSQLSERYRELLERRYPHLLLA